jgi:hypothetical protein
MVYVGVNQAAFKTSLSIRLIWQPEEGYTLHATSLSTRTLFAFLADGRDATGYLGGGNWA